MCVQAAWTAALSRELPRRRLCPRRGETARHPVASCWTAATVRGAETPACRPGSLLEGDSAHRGDDLFFDLKAFRISHSSFASAPDRLCSKQREVYLALGLNQMGGLASKSQTDIAEDKQNRYAQRPGQQRPLPYLPRQGPPTRRSL